MAVDPTSTQRTWRLTDTHVDLSGTKTSNKGAATFAARPQSLTIDLTTTALIIVDMQNDFCTEGGWLHAQGVDVTPLAAAVRPIADLADALRSRAVPVIWLNWGNRPDRRNLPPGVSHVYDPFGRGGGIGASVALSDAVLTEGSWGAQIVDELHVAPEDTHVAKYRMSGFFDTELDSILRQGRIETLLFAGVNADQCVYATLADAACLGYDVVFVEDASATTSPGYCLDATLYNVRQCFGFTATAGDITTSITPRATMHDLNNQGDK
ncbi:cysteine hydrolase family protein [uncultured Microbacterium sp.]|uniref:cysteine hydrolase family protein n=1 Tax=uncultured Microbacterium sp. TaxID=191216 RepID=UPI0035CBFB4D